MNSNLLPLLVGMMPCCEKCKARCGKCKAWSGAPLRCTNVQMCEGENVRMWNALKAQAHGGERWGRSLLTSHDRLHDGYAHLRPLWRRRLKRRALHGIAFAGGNFTKTSPCPTCWARSKFILARVYTKVCASCRQPSPSRMVILAAPMERTMGARFPDLA